MSGKTRIKICGLTRKEDVDCAIKEGVDALGFVFYPKSPRYVSPQTAGNLLSGLPPFITTVGLFVNSSLDEVKNVLKYAPVSLLQFHGDETPPECAKIAKEVNKPFIRAFRVREENNASDLIQYADSYCKASNLFAGVLLDTYISEYGGSGKVFNWSVIPKELAPRVVLSGGLNAQNVIGALKDVRPFAVDVSSGVEKSKGIKDAERIRDFISAVRSVS